MSPQPIYKTCSVFQGNDESKKDNYESDVKMESEADVKEENQEDKNHGQDRKRKRSRWYAQIKLSIN